MAGFCCWPDSKNYPTSHIGKGVVYPDKVQTDEKPDDKVRSVRLKLKSVLSSMFHSDSPDSLRTVKIFLITWNMNGRIPENILNVIFGPEICSKYADCPIIVVGLLDFTTRHTGMRKINRKIHGI
jgi:hypothetical protein